MYGSGNVMIKESIDRAKDILREWTGDSYTFGEDAPEARGAFLLIIIK